MMEHLGARYARNIGVISETEQETLATCSAAVVGLGGLGGYIAEELARFGIGSLTLIDGDVVEESNLNRQLFATEANVGRAKSENARARLLEVNSEVRCACHNVRLDRSNAADLLTGVDVVIDAVDNVEARLILEDVCRSIHVPLIHGAIRGWSGRVSVVFPGDDVMSVLYPGGAGSSDGFKAAPPFVAAVVGSIQVAETIKYLLGMGDLLRGKVLSVDLLEHEYAVFELPPRQA